MLIISIVSFALVKTSKSDCRQPRYFVTGQRSHIGPSIQVTFYDPSIQVTFYFGECVFSRINVDVSGTLTVLCAVFSHSW